MLLYKKIAFWFFFYFLWVYRGEPRFKSRFSGTSAFCFQPPTHKKGHFRSSASLQHATAHSSSSNTNGNSNSNIHRHGSNIELSRSPVWGCGINCCRPMSILSPGTLWCRAFSSRPMASPLVEYSNLASIKRQPTPPPIAASSAAAAAAPPAPTKTKTATTDVFS